MDKNMRKKVTLKDKDVPAKKARSVKGGVSGNATGRRAYLPVEWTT